MSEARSVLRERDRVIIIMDFLAEDNLRQTTSSSLGEVTALFSYAQFTFLVQVTW